MTPFVGIKSQLPLAIGALLLATAGCSFEPPGSVLNNTMIPGADGGGGGTIDAAMLPSTETLTFTFTSSPIATPISEWAPTNVVATWIEDAAGTHVATINRQSATRTVHLVAWGAVSGINNTDAVTGATRLNHGLVEVTWAIPGALANGIYTIRVETADDNTANGGTPADNNQGTFTFDKNGIASTNIGLNGNGYTGITIDYAVAAP